MIRTMMLATLAVAATGFAVANIPAPASAQAAVKAPDASAIGPEIGSRIDLNLPVTTSHGEAGTLRRFGFRKPMMLVFFRSAKWCPYCQAQLKALGPVADAAAKKGVRFAVVSYDDPAVLNEFGAKNALGYMMLSDKGSTTIDALSLRDPRYPPGNFAYGVPYPTTLMIAADGTIRGKIVETDYKIRPSQADLIALLDTL